ncbi:MAG: glycine cleavage system aminomethyltransferase GcvT [Lentilitoribacter sp.]
MADLLRTPLYDFHVECGAKLVPFAGYEMPVQYPLGVMNEHKHCRASAGLFDVSHMGQVLIKPKSGNIEDACLALETLVPMDICALKSGRQRYAFFTNDNGGILDDLMVANRGDHLFLVVNAACKDADIAHMRKHLSETCEISVIEDRALIALQGPDAEKVVSSLIPSMADLKFMDVVIVDYDGIELWVSRSGYTGEDGYEISIPSDDASAFVSKLAPHELVEPIGLGARDSLRLEGGLCLYGNDIDETTTPVEAALTWAIQKARRAGGAREGGFPGADEILAQFENGADRKRVGFLPEGRAPMRAGTKLFATETSSDEIGEITSGGFGPSVNSPVSMGYITIEFSDEGTKVFAEVRGKRLPATIAKMPFVAANFKR